MAGRLDHLTELGVTALQLMPVNAFAGRRNWGYDGVLPYATAATYGRPEDLANLVREAMPAGSPCCSTSFTITSARREISCRSMRPIFSRRGIRRRGARL